MVISKNPIPELGELVVARITNIQSGYIEVELEDYKGLENQPHGKGMVHISELSNRWVKNIHSIVAIGQRVVLLVLRIDKERGYVDLSLRRVTKEQKTSKMNTWRYHTKAENLLKFFSEQHNMTIEQLYANALFPIMDKYIDLRTGLEAIKEDGINALNQIPNFVMEPKLKDEFVTFVSSNVTIHKVEISAEFKIKSLHGQGIVIIKNALIEAKKIKKPKGLEMKLYYIGSPNYRVEIEANDYADAEKHLEKVSAKIEKMIGKFGLVELNRDMLSNEQKSGTTTNV